MCIKPYAWHFRFFFVPTNQYHIAIRSFIIGRDFSCLLYFFFSLKSFWMWHKIGFFRPTVRLESIKGIYLWPHLYSWHKNRFLFISSQQPTTASSLICFLNSFLLRAKIYLPFPFGKELKRMSNIFYNQIKCDLCKYSWNLCPTSIENNDHAWIYSYTCNQHKLIKRLIYV